MKANKRIEELKEIIFNEIIKLNNLEDDFKDEISKANTISNSVEVYLKACNLQLSLEKTKLDLTEKVK